MDWNAVVPALIGLAGVIVGLTVSERATRRREVLAAARRAALGLDRWQRAIRYIEVAPDRLRKHGDKYDIYLTHELHSLGEQLDNKWWDEHGVTLDTATRSSQWETIAHAGGVTRMLLARMHALGNAGEVALRKFAEAEAIRRTGVKPGGGHVVQSDVSGAEPLASRPGQPSEQGEGLEEIEDLDDDEWLARADEQAADFDAQLANFDLETRAGFIEIRAGLDHRLWLARDLAVALTDARGPVEAAMEVCKKLAARNEGLVGRRRLRSGRRDRNPSVDGSPVTTPRS